MAESSSKVIIVGASVRAAAWSALRAGFEPYCVDLFADRDLSRVATTQAISPDDYPEGLERALADAPTAPWFYTGALENRPGLVERLSRRLPLWGNGAAVLRRVRSPFLAADFLKHANLPCPAVCGAGLQPAMIDSGCNPARRWLLKPRFGAGGRGIKYWDGCPPPGSRRSHFLQEWIDGESCAAVFLAPGDGTALLLGATRQLIGLSWLNAGPFQYCGSVGPRPLTPSLREHYQLLGNTLAHDFALRGLFGVDCVIRNDVPWPVEINPRYTASMEIIEWAQRQSLVAAHAQAFGFEVKTQAESPLSTNGGMLAKAVFYASRPMVFPQEGPWCATLAQPWRPWAMPEFADIPAAGRRAVAGDPVVTIFARGENIADCVEVLQRKTRLAAIKPLAP